MLLYQGSQLFRYRLLLATLSGQSIRIDNIRENSRKPGLREYEASFLRLIEKLTNGCIVEINETGTTLRYKPGLLVGGYDLQHYCGLQRGMGYFIEPILILALYSQKDLSIVLTGITSSNMDLGIDTISNVTIPFLKKATKVDKMSVKSIKRGMDPEGQGEVVVSCGHIKNSLPQIDLLDEGMVKRIRGVAYSTKVSAQYVNRIVDGVRGVFNDYLSDVYVFTDAVHGAKSGASPGYGVMLAAETTSGSKLSCEITSNFEQQTQRQQIQQQKLLDKQLITDSQIQNNTDSNVSPEELGKKAALLLLNEIDRGGVVDGNHQQLALLLCSLGPEELNQIRIGPLSQQSIRLLRHIKDFFGVQFSLQPDQITKNIYASCIGIGVQNISRRVA